MTLSTLIVASDRVHETIASLQALETALQSASCPLSPTASDIFILLNAATPEMNLAFENFQKHTTLRLHPFYSGARLKPGAARNILLKECSSDWVFFVDDDATVTVDYFTRFYELAQQHPEAILIGGPNLTPPRSSFFQTLNGAVLSSVWGTCTVRSRYSPEGFTRLAKEEDLTSCGLFLRRGHLPHAQFPEFYRTAEESYLILSLLRQYPQACFYSPQLITYHQRRTSFAAFVKQIYGYARGRGRLIRDRQSSWGLFWIPTLSGLTGLILLSWPEALLTVLGIYITLTIGFSAQIGWKLKSPKAFLTSIPLFSALHISYALGFPVGLILPNLNSPLALLQPGAWTRSHRADPYLESLHSPIEHHRDKLSQTSHSNLDY